MKDSFKKAGYDLEEAYFYKVNQELIENIKLKKAKSRSHLRLVTHSEEPSQLTGSAEPPKKKAA